MMGNSVIVETMFRHHPGVIPYAPPGTAIYRDADDRTHLIIDQPSVRFASFGNSLIAAVGIGTGQRARGKRPHNAGSALRIRAGADH
jgi:hypothetical protein